MRFKIPFTFSNIERLKRKSRFFASRVRYKKRSLLNEHLKNSEIDLTREQYIGITFRSFFFNFLILFVIATTTLAFFSIGRYLIYGFLLAFLFAGFVMFSQRVYPRVYVTRKQKEIEKSLLSALEDILIQLNSGIPLFNILVNISKGDYGELSNEFKKAVRRINAGEPEAVVLADLGKQNPSIFLKRTLWQISNGMNAGSDMSIVIKDSIKGLNEEQLIQIQAYGNKLNPLIVLYMLISVIIPALSITFLTIISSLISLEKQMTILMFVALLIFNIFFQIMFLGLIKSKRPSLL